MPRFLDEVVANASADIIALCGDNAECIFDATETGDTNVGLESLNTNQENNNDQMIICKYISRYKKLACCGYTTDYNRYNDL